MEVCCMAQKLGNEGTTSWHLKDEVDFMTALL